MQTPKGNWQTSESRRPPMAAGEYQAAALAIYSLKQYSRPTEKIDTDKVLSLGGSVAGDSETHDYARPCFSPYGSCVVERLSRIG